MKINNLAVSSLLAFVLIGCGGGGGSSSSNSSDSSSSINTSFPSNAVVAEPTLENGEKVESNIGEDINAQYNFLNSVSGSSLNVSSLGNKISKEIFEDIKKINLKSYALNETVNETEQCTNGGNISITGEGDETNGGYINLTYKDCKEGNIILNGSIYAKMSNLDVNADEFKDNYMKFTSNLSYQNTSNPSDNATISKDSELSLNILSFDNYGSIKTYKTKLSIIASNTTEKFGIKDLEVYYDESSYSTVKWYYTSGRVYINNLTSYVELDTTYDMSNTPFVLSNNSLISGEARYNMSNGGKGKVIIENNTPITYIDANGDGTYELSENNSN